MTTDCHLSGIKGESPPYSYFYSTIGLRIRGRVIDWWISKYYGEFQVITKMYYPENPRTVAQQGNRIIFYDAVYNWKHFDTNTKEYYNQRTKSIGEYGYHRYIKLYLLANEPMIIYWNTLEKSASDASTVPDYIASTYFGQGLYPPAVKKIVAVGPSGGVPFPGPIAVDTINEKTLAEGVTVDGFLIKDKSTIESNGWINPNESWLYASATTITIPERTANIYQIGDKIKLTNITVKYFYIVGVTSTVLTITGGSDYTLVDDAITANYYSHQNNPLGFPDYFNWTPTFTGFSADPTNLVNRFCIKGRQVTFICNAVTAGTSNATNYLISGPVTSANITNNTNGGTLQYAIDNGVAITAPARWYITANSNSIVLMTDLSAGVWTASGSKRARVAGNYEI